VTVVSPPLPFTPPFTLVGPGVTQSEATIPSPESAPTLAVTQALGPGNFNVAGMVDGKSKPFAGFSLNIRPEESLLDRVEVAEIEAVLGPDTVLAPDRKLDLRAVLQSRWSPPVELLPWLMMGLLLLLSFEPLLANFFYRRQASPAAATPQAE